MSNFEIVSVYNTNVSGGGWRSWVCWHLTLSCACSPLPNRLASYWRKDFFTFSTSAKFLKTEGQIRKFLIKYIKTEKREITRMKWRNIRVRKGSLQQTMKNQDLMGYFFQLYCWNEKGIGTQLNQRPKLVTKNCLMSQHFFFH